MDGVPSDPSCFVPLLLGLSLASSARCLGLNASNRLFCCCCRVSPGAGAELAEDAEDSIRVRAALPLPLNAGEPWLDSVSVPAASSFATAGRF
jgi:hypothetical protein